MITSKNRKVLSRFFYLLLSLAFVVCPCKDLRSDTSEKASSYVVDNDRSEAVDREVKKQESFQAKFFNMLFILALLIGFMILTSWLLKRMMKARVVQVNQASLIKVLETRQLSPKSTLYVIEVDQKRVLLSESQEVRYLTTLSATPEDNS